MGGWFGAHDDVRLDEARDGFEDALRTVGLFLAPERKTFGEVLVTRISFEQTGR